MDKVANHAKCWGKIYKVNGSDGYAKNLKEETGYPSDPRGLCGYNCRHNMAPHFKGDSNSFIQYDSEENKKAYEVSQKQRRMERAIRKSKKEYIAYKAALDQCQDNDTYKELLARYERKAATLGKQNKRYIEYSAENNVKTQQERLKVYQWNKDQAAAARGASAKQRKRIANNKKTAILKKEHTKEAVDVHFICKIDLNLYKSMASDIITDEVIITDERIQHIIDRRGQEFYNRYGHKFMEILKDPDYIFEDKHNTALVCKQFLVDDKYVNLALRLVVSTDNPNYKNSIITAVGESSKRFQQRLRNNKPLYKKE